MDTASLKRPPGPDEAWAAAVPYSEAPLLAVVLEEERAVPNGETAWVVVEARKVEAP